MRISDNALHVRGIEKDYEVYLVTFSAGDEHPNHTFKITRRCSGYGKDRIHVDSGNSFVPPHVLQEAIEQINANRD